MTAPGTRAAAPEAGTRYSRAHAEVYDLVHGARGRDWAGEADDIAGLVLARAPGARSLLDVACGTGRHLERFRHHFAEVEGLELSAPMRELARRRLPGVPLHEGDMRAIDLPRTFDAVVCLCFSLGYMTSVPELTAAVRSLASCLAPGGVVVAEPWWFPDQFLDGFVTGAVAEEPGRVVTRSSRTVRDGRSSLMTVHYTVADGRGIRSFVETEAYSLFTLDEYLRAFAEAGLEATFTPGGPNGRGLFTAGRR